MDFFQGSLPPNFISFCLEQQNVDEPQVQSITTTGNSTALPQRPLPISMPSSTPSPPPFPPIRTFLGQAQQLTADSPFSNESNVDVTAYADEMVQRMEVSQGLTDTDPASPKEEEPSPAQDPVVPDVGHVPIQVRTSTPTPFEQPGTEVTSISQLESSLSVAPQSQSGFPELQLAQNRSHDTSAVSFLQSDDEASSSVHEPLHSPVEQDISPLQGTTVTPPRLLILPVSLKFPSCTRASLLERGQHQRLKKTQDQKYTIQDHQGLLGLILSHKKKFCEICQDAVEPRSNSTLRPKTPTRSRLDRGL